MISLMTGVAETCAMKRPAKAATMEDEIRDMIFGEGEPAESAGLRTLTRDHRSASGLLECND